MMNTIPSLRWLLGSLLVLLLLGSQWAAGQTPDTAKAKPAPKAEQQVPKPAPPANCPDCLPETTVACNTNLKTVTLDFNCRCFDKDAIKTLNGLKQGELYRLHIANINLLLYKVTLGVRDTSIATALPFPTLASGSLSDLTGLAAGLTPVSIATKATAATVVPATIMMKRLERVSLAEDKNNKEETARQLIADYTTEVANEVTTLDNLNQRQDAALLKYGTMLAYARLDYSHCINPQPTLPTAPDIGMALKELTDIRADLTQLRQRAEAANKKYLADTAPYQKLIEADAGLKAGDDQVKNLYKQFGEALTKAEASVAAGNVQQLVKALTDAVNNSCLQYVSLPQQVTQQNTRLRIDITPRSPDYSVPEYHTQLVFPIERRHFWGISSGLFVSHLYSDAYSARAQTSAAGVTTYTLVEENPGRFEFGTSAMLRYGGTVNEKHSVGLQLGFGPALAVSTKVRPRLLAGGGFSFGDIHKVLLDGGVAIGYVDRRSAAYDLTTSYAAAPDNAVVSVLRADFYVGLHYLFTK